MAVMQNFREYTKIILIILVLAFVATIIFDWGMDILGLSSGQNPVVGEVNGQEITYQQFNQAYRNHLESYRQQADTEPTDRQLDALRNQTWESLVRDILIQQELKERGIEVSDDEIVYRLFNAPPDFIKAIPAFQDEQNQFDMARYQAALNNPQVPAEQWAQVEAMLRMQLPFDELQERIQLSVRLTEDEIRRAYSKDYQTVRVAYLLVDPGRFRDQEIDISEEQIQTYYQEHLDEFHEEEKRKIEYVAFSKQATAEDSAAQWRLAEELIERLQAGENFADLAEIYSQDTGTRDKGGDLGYFGRGSMVKPFEEAAFEADVGEVVGPVKTNFGLHIIKVEDRRVKDGEEEVKARHILLKFEPSPATLERAREEALYLVEDAQTRSFETLAEERGFKVHTTPFFGKSGEIIPGVGREPEAINFIFSENVGSIGEVLETPQAYYAYRIADVQKAHTRPLEDVKETIRGKLIVQERMRLAGELAREVYEKLQAGASLEDVAAEYDLTLRETDEFTRSDFVPGVGRDTKFVGAAFALNEAQAISKPVEGTRGYYIIKLLEKSEFDEEDYRQRREAIARRLLQQKRSQVFAQWYAGLKEQADIKDYRYRFF